MAGSIFLVTGAGRDIGHSIALKLMSPEAFGIFHYANSGNGAARLLAQLRALGGDGIAVQADLGTSSGVETLIAATLAAIGKRKIDTVVFNAAATAATPVGNSDDAALNAMIAVNLLAPQRLMNKLVGHLSDNASVTAISIAAIRQVFHPDYAFFTATKAGVDVLVKGWAVALGPRGIRVNSVAPGVVDANFRSAMLADPAFRASLEAATALGRSGRPDDIAAVVHFLASEDARWITGQTIDASGGWML
jgi:3-oxoacyl-[acyl-carrier protein] reductase